MWRKGGCAGRVGVEEGWMWRFPVNREALERRRSVEKLLVRALELTPLLTAQEHTAKLLNSNVIFSG